MNPKTWEQQASEMFLSELIELIGLAETEVLALESASESAPGIHNLFRAFHTIKGGAGMVGWQDLANYTNRLENLLTKVRSGSLAITGNLVSLLLESIDCLKGFYQEAAGTAPLPQAKVTRSLETLSQWENGAPIIQPPVDAVEPPTVLPLPRTKPESQPEPTEYATEPPSRTNQTMRVGIEKLDNLVNLVGEAVTNHARMVQAVRQLELTHESLAEGLWSILDDHERITHGLQEQVNTIRLVPIGVTLQSFQRMVRDYAEQSGKSLRLEVLGGATELDKEVIERISGPLKHLVRNAMDHGIESPAARVLAGKPGQGTITLRADHRKGAVFIEVADDGQGIDPAKILASAKAKGILPSDAEPDPEKLFQLLFQPGFSTNPTANAISGRGVGLDVVKQEIDALHGAIAIRSQVGQGSSFLIQLPLTLAIIEGMLVRVADQILTIPLVAVVESLQPKPVQLKAIHGRQELLEVRGEYLPLIRLHRRFHLPEGQSDLPSLVVIVESAGRKVCLLVDEIVDQQTIVIKSVEENFIPIPDIAGATLLGDGSVSLILDVANLFSI